MPPIPDPGYGPIAGSVLHFDFFGFVFALLLMIMYAIWVRNNPYFLFLPLVVFSAFTEEIVFHAFFTWRLGQLYLFVFGPVVLVCNTRFELPRSTLLAYLVTSFTFLLALFFSFRFVGTVAPPSAVFTRLIRETGRWLLLLAVPLAFYAYLNTQRTWLRLVDTQVVVAGVISILSFVWLILTYSGVMPPSLAAILIEPGGITLRLSGTFTEPSQFATYLTLSLLIGIGPAIERTRRGDFFNTIWLVPISLALVFTYSTSAFVMLLIAVVVGGLFIFDVLMIQRKSVVDYFIRMTYTIVGGTIVVTLIGLAFNFVLTNVLTTLPNPPGPKLVYVNTVGKLATITDSIRWFALVTGVQMWLDHPILGVGFGNHLFLYSEYSVRSLSSGRGPVSTILNVLTSAGLIGLFAFILYLTNIHRQVRQTFKTTILEDNWTILGIYLTFFGLIAGYGINPNFRLVYNAVFLGLILGSTQFHFGHS